MEQFGEPSASQIPERKGSLVSQIIIGLAFLLPVFLVPFSSFPFQFSKIALVLVVVAVVFFLGSIKTLRSGVMNIVWSPLLLGVLLLPALYFVGSLFSIIPSASLFGYQLETDTFGFIALAAALTLMTVGAIRTERNILSTLTAFLVAGWVVVLFQILQFIFGGMFSLPLLSTPISNLLGKWNDLALFVGLVGSLALVSLETLSLPKLHRGLLWATILVSLFFLAVVNFALAWLLFGVVAFMMLVYSFVRMRAPGSRGWGTSSLVVFAVVVFFALAGGSLSASLQNGLNIQALEVRPSMEGTVGVMNSIYSESPVFGAGPNTFSLNWFKSRPTDIISTPFWDVNFSAGFGFIPTAVATGGIAVLLGWLLFIGLFLWYAVRALLKSGEWEGKSAYFTAATALAVTYLIIAHVFYVPSAVMTLLMFLFFGLFVSSLRGTQFIKEGTVLFSENPRFGFVSVLGIAVCMVLALVSVYGVGRVYASSVYHDRAIQLSGTGDLEAAIASATQATTLVEQDRYFRTRTALDLIKLQSIVATNETDTKTQEEFRTTLTQAINDSARAVELNPHAFENWMTRASVYGAVVPLNIQGAFDNAKAALEEARGRNPGTPEIDFRLAELSAVRNEIVEAREFAAAALKKKADYTPAVLLLAQLSFNEGKLDEAIRSVEAAVYFEPQNPQLMYQLGLLRLEAKDYAGAQTAFETALKISPEYANASFFLGQAYVFLKKNDEAMEQFKTLSLKNPDNQVLKDVITALEKGENPFLKGTPLPPEETASVTP